ncbi:MAG: phosphoribosyltransferase family protein [Patescibacteria group bacterium]|nr:phosphoribosyltransferase family protein [Patescibacteria group bacterium]
MKEIPGVSAPPDTDIHAIFAYQNKVIKKALWELKYKKRTIIAKQCADLLYDRMLEELSDMRTFHDFTNPLLVPIPLSAKRLRERGFNQSELIAREIHRRDCGRSFTLSPDLLMKTKDTQSQMSIKDKAKRAENIKGCFAVVDQPLTKGKNIILIDDITTTGATLKEARRVLLEAGARKVIAFTVAH